VGCCRRVSGWPCAGAPGVGGATPAGQGHCGIAGGCGTSGSPHTAWADARLTLTDLHGLRRGVQGNVLLVLCIVRLYLDPKVK